MISLICMTKLCTPFCKNHTCVYLTGFSNKATPLIRSFCVAQSADHSTGFDCKCHYAVNAVTNAVVAS